MGFWDIFQTGKTAEKALDVVGRATDGVVAGIDKVWFTKEEKAELNYKVIESHIKLMEVLAKEDTSKGLTRRYLSFMFCGTFLTMVIAAGAIWRFDPTWCQVLIDLLKLLSTPTMAVVIFYFGMYAFQGGVKAVKNKE